MPCGSARKEASCRYVGQSMAGLGRAGTRAISGYPDPAAPSAGWPADRRWRHDRLAVDADRDLHCDGDDAERPGVEPRPAAERCTANTARAAIGVAVTTAKASYLSTPRWARNQYAPAATRHAPTAPTATIATLPRLAKADRASLRRCGPLAARRIAAGGGSCARSVLMIMSLADTAGRNPRVLASRPAGRRARDHHLPRPPPATSASGAGPADRCQPLQRLRRREQMPSGPPGVASWPDEAASWPDEMKERRNLSPRRRASGLRRAR